MIELWKLICSWWLSDRIRTSPKEGRLLRIRPGDIIRVGEVEAEIVARSVVDREAGATLCLTCETSTGIAEASIDIDHQGRKLVICWNEQHTTRELDAEDIEVWPRNGF